MRIAVTTDDLERIDAPFGLARHVAIYDLTAAGLRRRTLHEFPQRA